MVLLCFAAKKPRRIALRFSFLEENYRRAMWFVILATIRLAVIRIISSLAPREIITGIHSKEDERLVGPPPTLRN